jgi:hypothetical protein
MEFVYAIVSKMKTDTIVTQDKNLFEQLQFGDGCGYYSLI